MIVNVPSIAGHLRTNQIEYVVSERQGERGVVEVYCGGAVGKGGREVMLCTLEREGRARLTSKLIIRAKKKHPKKPENGRHVFLTS